MVDVFIVDRQSLFREGIRSSLSQVEDINISGESDFENGVLASIESSAPDVVLLDIDVPSLSGLTLCYTIKKRLPSVSVIILSPQLEDDQLFQAIKDQASACLSKTVSTGELVQAIRRSAGGEHPINESLLARPKVAEQILQEFRDFSREGEAADFISPLTPRESEILDYMAQGYLNKQIATALSIREQTVKNHITSILRKLNANARTQAVVIAVKKGLVFL